MLSVYELTYLVLLCFLLLATFAFLWALPLARNRRLSKRALYINMPRQKKRKQHMETLLSDMGFRGEHVKPVKHDVPWKSLSLTHKLCIEMIARDKSSLYICVFEDDAELSTEIERKDVRGIIEQQLSALQSVKGREVGLVKLGACLDLQQRKACRPGACQSWCTHAYMLTPQLARSLLKEHGKEWTNYHSDFAYMKFVPSPPLVGHWLSHNHTHLGWLGLFYQARQSAWYEEGMSEKSHDVQLLSSFC